MVKIAFLGVVTVLCANFFQGGKREYGFMIALCGGGIIFTYGILKFSGILECIEKMEQYMGAAATFYPLLLKMVGITYLTDFSADLCKDAGYSFLGSQVELMGKISVLFISVPVISTLMEMIGEFVV